MQLERNDIAQPLVEPNVYDFVHDLVEPLAWNRNAAPYPANGGAKHGWGDGDPPHAHMQLERRGNDISPTGLDKSVYEFTNDKVETLPWHRNEVAYPVNGGYAHGWGNGDKRLMQVGDVANGEMRPDVWMATVKNVTPVALWRSDKPPSIGNFEAY
jgi:hypothetical protein